MSSENSTTEKKNICLVLPSLSLGGMERVMTELALHFFEKKNASVSLVLLAKREKFFILPEGIRIYEPPFEFNSHSWLVQLVKTVFYLRKTISHLKPDTVLSFCERYNSFVILSTLFLNIKIFVSDRASPKISSGKYIDLLNKFVYKLADGIVAQTQIAKDILFARNGNKNIKVIGNPIKFISRNPNIKRENVILNIGRFADQKNQELLLRYFFEINNPEWRIIFVGDGHRINEIKKLAQELNLTDKVEFAERTNDIGYFYSVAKIFAFTSTSEGFPNALGEALSAPLAAISFDCIAGPKDLIENGVNGFLIRVTDHEDYKKKLVLLMTDSNLRDKFETEAIKRIQKYNVESIGNEFYNFIINRN